MLTEFEKKLLTLGLNKGAQGNEIDNAAIAFFKSLRKRSVTAEELLKKPISKPDFEPPVTRRDDYYVIPIMPFGKHRGKYLDEIPLSYLKWCYRVCTNASVSLRAAIKKVIDDN